MQSFVIETQGLTKRYGSVAAVDSLSLQVQGGGVFGLLGPNGSGKTTTMLSAASLEKIPEQWHAFAVLVGYMAVMGGLAFWVFRQRDIRGASGG